MRENENARCDGHLSKTKRYHDIDTMISKENNKMGFLLYLH